MVVELTRSFYVFASASDMCTFGVQVADDSEERPFAFLDAHFHARQAALTTKFVGVAFLSVEKRASLRRDTQDEPR